MKLSSATLSPFLRAYKDAENYLLRYMRLSQPVLEGLVLGVKIERSR